MKFSDQMRRWPAVLLPAVIAIAGLLLYSGAGSQSRVGADERAEETIRQRHFYRPWFRPLWTPGESTEALLFLAQAVAGAVVLGIAVWRLRARKK